jgi:hypothetical protein
LGITPGASGRHLDPSQPYEIDAPPFDPEQPYEVVDEQPDLSGWTFIPAGPGEEPQFGLPGMQPIPKASLARLRAGIEMQQAARAATVPFEERFNDVYGWIDSRGRRDAPVRPCGLLAAGKRDRSRSSSRIPT